MFQFSVDVEGDPARELANIRKRILTRTVTIVAEAADDFVDTITQMIESTPRRRDGTSRPGNPPASQSGHLLSSVEMRPENGGLQQRGGPGAHYAGYLEGGTEKMEARPFVEPALEVVEARFYGQIVAMVSNP